MAVKAQRATDCDPFACHVRRRGGEVKSGCGRIASARMLVGWASSRALAPPALATSCSMMVRFTPRLPTNLELTALSRALCARSIESRHPGSSAGGVHIRALAEVQAEIATQFGSTENLACVVAPLMCARQEALLAPASASVHVLGLCVLVRVAFYTGMCAVLCDSVVVKIAIARRVLIGCRKKVHDVACAFLGCSVDNSEDAWCFEHP